MKAVSSKKARDRAVILDVARRMGPLSRVAIHSLTHLRQGTISSLVRELIRENWLVESGLSDNPIGRKQVLLRLNEDHGYIGAIEFDAEQVVTAVLNLGARIKVQSAEPSYLDGGVEGLVKQLVACARKAPQRAAADGVPLVALGVADPGLIDSRAGVCVTSSTIEFWRNVPLGRVFEREFGVPFLLESNARARTVAERSVGVGAGAADMLYLDYGAGIGLGVIAGGQLLRGSRECAAEFGHTHIMPDGPPCKCGSFGCLEAIAGAPAVAARARKAIGEGGASKAMELANGGPITALHVLEAARQGDKLCASLMEDVARYLGLGLANAVNLFNPSLVVVDRRLGAADPGFLDQLTRAVRRGSLERATQELTFRFSQLGEEAGVLGMALLAIERIFEIPVLHAPKFMTEAAYA